VLLVVIVFRNAVDWDTYLYQSILERKNQYLSIALIPWQSILLGLGYGGYVAFIAELGIYQAWQLQPIHNVLVMAVLEIGVLPLAILFLLIRSYLPKSLYSLTLCKNKHLLLVFFLIVPLLLFDHYFWDLEQGVFSLGVLVVVTIAMYKNSLYTKKLL
jgi:hypothetical protein